MSGPRRPTSLHAHFAMWLVPMLALTWGCGEPGRLGNARFESWSPCYSCPQARLVLPGARAGLSVRGNWSGGGPCMFPAGVRGVDDDRILRLLADAAYPADAACSGVGISVEGGAPGLTTVFISSPPDSYAFGTATRLAHISIARDGQNWFNDGFADVDVRRLVLPVGASESLDVMLRDPEFAFIVPEDAHWSTSDVSVAAFAQYPEPPWTTFPPVATPIAAKDATSVDLLTLAPGSATLIVEDRGIHTTVTVEVLDAVDFSGRLECRVRATAEICGNERDDDCDALTDESECTAP